MAYIMTLWLGNSVVLESSCRLQLTHSHTMTPFDAPGKRAF